MTQLDTSSTMATISVDQMQPLICTLLPLHPFPSAVRRLYGVYDLNTLFKLLHFVALALLRDKWPRYASQKDIFIGRTSKYKFKDHSSMPNLWLVRCRFLLCLFYDSKYFSCGKYTSASLSWGSSEVIVINCHASSHYSSNSQLLKGWNNKGQWPSMNSPELFPSASERISWHRPNLWQRSSSPPRWLQGRPCPHVWCHHLWWSDGLPERKAMQTVTV